MATDDLRQLRAVLREAVRALRIPVRDWERRLGIGNGNLDKLLDGTLELRVRHIVAFAQLLRVSPGDLLDTGCPDLVRQAEHRVSDWIASAPSRPAHKAEPATSPVLSDELVAAIREAVRQELAGDSGPKKQ
ncbi:MAG TPA: helix-turn-helix transcriptional regulator [Thermoanaerobaculia bacterium]|nr:helix-turn-helix transcriptional regulator [Thermoanaerobaculia bacterium]